MNERKKVFAFHGVDYKVGSTMVAQSVAEMIASAKKEKKVLILFLNGRSSTEYCREEPESIETIRMSVDNKMLTLPEFMKTCCRTGNLYMLAGVRGLFEQRLYGPDISEYLIWLVRDAFDVILVDCGNEIDNGLALGALRSADEKLLILTQQESVLARYDSLREIYSRLKIYFDRIIMNKYVQEDPHDEVYLAKRLARDKKEIIPVHAARYARQAEIDYRTLLEYKEAGYCGGIRELVGFILKEAGIDPEIHTKVGRLWKSFI